MPVFKYLLWVGGGLLALLFVADVYIPRQPEQTATPYTYNIPIASSSHNGPHAITFRGQTRDFGAPPPMTVVDFAAQSKAATKNAEQPTLQARAEMSGASPAAAQNTKPARQKAAKRKVRRYSPADHNPDSIPDGWRGDRPTGLAFARPFSW